MFTFAEVLEYINIRIMINEAIKFPENVLLIDADFLNFIIKDIRKHFEPKLNRTLQKIDLTNLVTCLCLDAGLVGENNSVQVVFVCNQSSEELEHCEPSNFETELNGTAFNNELGEFLFASAKTEQLVTQEGLFLDLLKIVADAKDVKKIIMLSNDENNKDILSIIDEAKEKQFVNICMEPKEDNANLQYSILAYPLMHVLGIDGSEL